MNKQWRKLAVLPLAVIGAYLYRLRGGGPGPNLPRPIDQLLFNSFPCIFITGYLLYLPVSVYTKLGGLDKLEWHIFAAWAIGWVVVNTIAVAVECTGHGGFMDLGTWLKARKDERLEFVIKPLHGKLSEYWYDALGLALTGFAVTLLPGIYLSAAGYFWAGVLLAVSGALKAPGYMVGRLLFGNTEAGEWISGGFRWAAAGLIYAFLM